LTAKTLIQCTNGVNWHLQTLWYVLPHWYYGQAQ